MFSLLWKWKDLLTVIKCKSLPSWRWHTLARCIYLAARRVSQVHSCCSQEHRFPLHPLLRSTLPRRSTPVPIPKRFLHSFSFSSCVILNWMSVKCKSNLTCFPNFQSSIFHKKLCFYCVLEINFNLYVSGADVRDAVSSSQWMSCLQ